MSMEIAVLPTQNQLEPHQKLALTLETRSNQIAHEIQDEMTYQNGASFVKEIKKSQKTWISFVSPFVASAKDNHKKAVQLRDGISLTYEKAIRMVGSALDRYEFDANQKKRQEDERNRREAQNKIDDAKLELAEEAEKGGDQQRAETILDTKIEVPPMNSAPVAKAQGISYTVRWAAQITDLRALVEAVAAHKVPIETLVPNMIFLNQQARSFKDKLSIPGIQAVSARSTNIR